MNRMIKRISIICLSIWILSLTVYAEETDQNVTLFTDENGDFQYSINQDGTAEIKDYLGSDEEVVIPQLLDGIAVTAIGDYAFYNSYDLWDITIPEGVTTIGEYAFASCYEIDTIEIPASVSFIGTGAFSECGGLSQINVSADNSHYEQKEGVLFEKESKKLIVYPAGRETGTYYVPDGTKIIEDMAFLKCLDLTEVKIPDSVEQIGNMVFKGCNSLTSINVSADNDYYTQIEGVLFKKAEKELIAYPPGRESAGYSIPDGIEIINDFAFANCHKLNGVNIPDSVVSIGNSAFVDCTGLNYMEIPDNVASIGSGAFEGCKALSEINVSADNSYYAQIEGVLFEKSEKRLMFYPAAKEDDSYSIPDGITIIGDNAFDSCYNLCNVKIPDSVNNIGDSAFAWCFNLNSIRIPNGVTAIGEKTFLQCNNLNSVEFPDSLISIGDSAFLGCTSLNSVELPNGLTSIEDSAFYTCGNLSHMIIPASVSNIGDRAFGECRNLTSISVSADNEYYGQIDGVLFEKASKKLVAYPAGKEETMYSIPDGIEAVGGSAFYSCYNLTSVILPNSLTSIGDSAFLGCSQLNDIMFPDSVVSIEDSAFAGCSSLKNLNLSDNITYIGKNVFSGCYDLVLTLNHDSYANQWARKNRVSYTYPDVNNWLYENSDTSGNMEDVSEGTDEGESYSNEKIKIENDSDAEYIIPGSDSRYLTEADVENLTLQQINYAKNEIYARRGRKFASQELQDYFTSKSWYQGIYEGSAFDANMNSYLNEYEIANGEFLSAIEYQMSSEGYQLDQPGYDINAV